MNSKCVRVLKKLQAKARRWGGAIEQVPEPKPFAHHGGVTTLSRKNPHMSQAPFTAWDIGVDYERKRVYFSTFGMPDDVDDLAQQLVHEMGHVFASKKSPDMSNESDFFGWELVMVRELGLSKRRFLTNNRDYGTDSGDNLGNLSRKELKLFLERAMLRAKELGIVKRGRALPLR